MRRLIDVGRFNVITDTPPEGMDRESYVAGQQSILNMIYDAPTEVDSDVIRCLNCKWFQDERNEFTGSDGFCPNVAHGVSVDWFCADGERKDDGDC